MDPKEQISKKNIWNSNLFIYENAFQNGIWKTVAILFILHNVSPKFPAIPWRTQHGRAVLLTVLIPNFNNRGYVTWRCPHVAPNVEVRGRYHAEHDWRAQTTDA